MGLERDAQTVIDMTLAAGRPPYHTLSPKEARQLFRETRAAVQPKPPEMALVTDLTADGPHGPVPLRLYRPRGVASGTPLPALVYYHGGGWVIGDLDTHDVVCRQLAEQSGIAVVSVDYRLAPEHKFPAAVDDAFAALAWAAGGGAAHGIDGRRLAVGGDSAGGNLAAVVSILARDQGGPAVSFQLLVYPVTDMASNAPSHTAFANGYLLTQDSMRWFIDHYLPSPKDASDWRASPRLAPSLQGLPPALVMTAGYDPLRDEGDEYARQLREAGNVVDHVCYGGMIHGFVGMGRLVATANRAIAHAGASLRQVFAAGC
jgi:acetyl esterase